MNNVIASVAKQSLTAKKRSLRVKHLKDKLPFDRRSDIVIYACFKALFPNPLHPCAGRLSWELGSMLNRLIEQGFEDMLVLGDYRKLTGPINLIELLCIAQTGNFPKTDSG